MCFLRISHRRRAAEVVEMECFGSGRRILRSQFVADLPQEVLAPVDLLLVLDALRGEAVHHAEDATALFGFGQDDLRGVGRSVEDATHFRHHLQRVQHVERIEAIAEKADKAMPGPDGSCILLRQFDHGRVGAGPADEALAGGFAEGQPELDAGLSFQTATSSCSPSTT